MFDHRARAGDPASTQRSTAARIVVTLSPCSLEGACAAARVGREVGLKQLVYWVGTDNGRAVAFASSFGFRPTDDRRPMRIRGVANFRLNADAAAALRARHDRDLVRGPA